MIYLQRYVIVDEIERYIKAIMAQALQEFQSRFPKRAQDHAWIFRCCVVLMLNDLQARNVLHDRERAVLNHLEQFMLASMNAIELRDLIDGQIQRLVPRFGWLFGSDRGLVYNVFSYLLLCPLFQRSAMIQSLSAQCASWQDDFRDLQSELNVERAVNQDLQFQVQELRQDLDQVQASLLH